jgi:hypothetical protein
MFPGLLMGATAIAMLVAAFVLPDEARIGLIGGAIGVGLGAAALLYLNWPERRHAPVGKVKADAFVLDARLTGAEATGNRIVEMTLEVRPKGGVPFQVTRKFLGTMPTIEQGQEITVYYDPSNPDDVTLG